LPPGPWQEISVDFWGPTPDNKYVLVFMDEYSRFPILEIISSTSAETVIPVFDKVFAMFGIPFTCKSDNGPPFTSEKFKQFMQYIGCTHRRITPLWPQANGMAERFMKNLGKIASTCSVEKKNWKQEMYKFLRNYCATPHSSTNVPPSVAMFGRFTRVKLPSMHDTETSNLDSVIRPKDNNSKEKFRVGDKVLVQQKKKNKFSPKYNPNPYTVKKVKGPMITAEFEGHSVTRNLSLFKRYTGSQVPADPDATGILLRPTVTIASKSDHSLLQEDRSLAHTLSEEEGNVDPPQPRHATLEQDVVDDASHPPQPCRATLEEDVQRSLSASSVALW
jgi:hypothetical protein